MSGIYIHIPFCVSKCTYCDFASYPKEIGKAESYFACLYREIKGRGLAYGKRTFDTVYIGGGTPSAVDAKFIAGALKQVRNCFTLSACPEITVEINPGTVNEEKVNTYLAAGINRFSVGLQTGYDEQLKRLNRPHTAKDFLLCCKLLKGQNVSADLLIGLAGQTAEQVKKSIDLALAGGASHISVYALTPEPGTPVYSDYLNGELPGEDEVADFYDAARAYLKENGLFRYEVSNFAKAGFESRHNLNYWRRGEYVGVGVSASSFMDGRRFTNTYSIDEYMNAVILNKAPEIYSENIEEKDAEFEFIMLGLRTAEGISAADFKSRFGKDFFKEYAAPLKSKAEYLETGEDRIRIKDDYLFVQNGIIMEFMK